MTVVTTLPYGRPLTRADLDLMPDDDGHRYELIDGVLLVSPGPVLPHQDVVGNLHLLLRAACTAEYKVVLAPFDTVLADDTVIQPDLIVARRDQLIRTELPGAPTLAVEVLSPSTRRFDQVLKRDRLQSAGVGSFWLVDPEEPSVTVLDLQDGVLVETGRVSGDEGLEVTQPFPMRIVPSQLRD